MKSIYGWVWLIVVFMMAAVMCGDDWSTLTTIKALEDVRVDQSASDLGVMKGKVVDAKTGYPIPGAKVIIGDKFDFTDELGGYEIVGLKVGEDIIKVVFGGYQPHNSGIEIKGGLQNQDIGLVSEGPVVVLDETSAPDIVYLDGATVHDRVITVEGALRHIISAGELTGLKLVVNGNFLDGFMDEKGYFKQEVVVKGGANTLQLLVIDGAGNAGLSRVINFDAYLPRTDVRILLKFDPEVVDLDLHFLKPGAKFGSEDGDCNIRRMSGLASVRPDKELALSACGLKVEGFSSMGQMPLAVLKSGRWDWGVKGEVMDNPLMDISCREGLIYENLVLQQAPEGFYKVILHNCGKDNSVGGSLQIWLKEGSERAKNLVLGPFKFSKADEKVEVCNIRMPKGEIEVIKH